MAVSSCAAPTAGNYVFSQPNVALPLDVSSGTLVVHASLDGGEGVPFYLDNGTTDIYIVSLRVAENLGMDDRTSIHKGRAEGGAIDVRLAIYHQAHLSTSFASIRITTAEHSWSLRFIQECFVPLCTMQSPAFRRYSPSSMIIQSSPVKTTI